MLKKAKCVYNESKLRPYNHDKVRGVWIHGDSGSGKDYSVREFARMHGKSLYIKTTKDKFLSGYQGEEIILWTNVEKEDMKNLRNHIKVWTDRYAWRAE